MTTPRRGATTTGRLPRLRSTGALERRGIDGLIAGHAADEPATDAV